MMAVIPRSAAPRMEAIQIERRSRNRNFDKETAPIPRCSASGAVSFHRRSRSKGRGGESQNYHGDDDDDGQGVHNFIDEFAIGEKHSCILPYFPQICTKQKIPLRPDKSGLQEDSVGLLPTLCFIFHADFGRCLLNPLFHSFKSVSHNGHFFMISFHLFNYFVNRGQ